MEMDVSDTKRSRAPKNLILLRCQMCGYRVSVPVVSSYIDRYGKSHIAICEMHMCPDCDDNAWTIADDQPDTYEAMVAFWDERYQ